MFEYVQTIIFQVTSDCNLKCEYCFIDHRSSENVINMPTFQKIIQRIILDRSKAKTQKVPLEFCFHGGEPTLIGPERLGSLIKYAHAQFSKNKLCVNFALQTNLTLLDKKYLPFLKKYRIHVSGSCDGFGRGNNYRTKIFTAEQYIKIFRMLKSANITYSNLLVAHAGNINDVAMFQYLFWKKFKRRIRINYVEAVKKHIRGKTTRIVVSSKQYFHKIVQPDIDLFIKNPKAWFSYTTLDYIQRFVENSIYAKNNRILPKGNCFTRFCGAGLRIVGVNSCGDVFLCGRFIDDYKVGFLGDISTNDFLSVKNIKVITNLSIAQDKVIRLLDCDNCNANTICNYGCQAMYYKRFEKFGVRKSFVCALYKQIIKYLVLNEEQIYRAYFLFILENKKKVILRIPHIKPMNINHKAMFFKVLRQQKLLYRVHENNKQCYIEILRRK